MRARRTRFAAVAVASALAFGIAGSSAALADDGSAADPAAASASLASLLDASVTAGANGSYTVRWTGVLAYGQVDVYASTDSRDPQSTGTKVASSRTGSAVVDGLDPAKRWYFQVVPAKGAYSVETATRGVGVQGALNTRDLGGYRTANGRIVKYGEVFRSDSFGKATDAGVAKLAGLDLDAVYDFRVTGEIGSNGPNRLPAGVASREVPLSDGGVLATVVQAVSSGDPVKQQEMLGDGKAQKFMEDVNRSFVNDPAKRAEFTQVLKAIAAGDRVAFNCSAGKDRTGWMAATLLTALGVDKSTVYADYLASNDYLKPSIDATINGMVASGALQNPELVRPLLGVQTSYLDAGFDEVRKVYGSFDNYLRSGLGIDSLTLAKLKLRLLTV